MEHILISFVTVRNNRGIHHSVVKEMMPPVSAQAALDLRISLAMEYGAESVKILNWDILPGRDAHPGGPAGPFPYFISFMAVADRGLQGFDCYNVAFSEPLLTTADIRGEEEECRSALQLDRVVILSCKPLAEATPEQVADIQIPEGVQM